VRNQNEYFNGYYFIAITFRLNIYPNSFSLQAVIQEPVKQKMAVLYLADRDHTVTFATFI
jgi:hypothetical protein